jgi:4-amino-4-deoxy-L-arabinose transferase-like glycosyltransferase
MKGWLPVTFIILFVILSLGSVWSESLTFDEIVHQEEGVNALTRHTFLVDTNNPPFVRELAMLSTALHIGIPPRYVVILLGAALLCAVYLVTKCYFGRTQAVLALFLLALEPNILANSHYVTLDAGFTLFFFLAYIAFLRWPALAAGAVLGLAAASKIFTLPFFAVSALLAPVPRRTLKYYLLFICSAAIVIWATYFFAFDTVIVSRTDRTRLSSRVHILAKTHNLPFLESSLRFFETQKLPLGNYLAVVKNTIVRTQAGQKIFFRGTFYDKPRWYFLPVNLFYKIPLPLWILFFLGTVAGGRLFIAPGLVIIAIVSLSGSQPWVRYVLPAVPFLCIVASGSVKLLFTGLQKVIFMCLILWYASCAVNAFPHFISYANELAGNETARYTLFMDSNLDWGQSLPDVRAYTRIAKPITLYFSYFGRDDADRYGLKSTTPYGSHIFENICAFHNIPLPYLGSPQYAISVSNWYYCGYYKKEIYGKDRIRRIIGNSILIFYD